MEQGNLYRLGGWTAVLIGGVVILLVGAIASKLILRPVRRVLGVSESYGVGGSIVINLVRVAVWAITIATLLDQCFGINAAGIVSALGVVGIAVSLGAQQTIANVIGGLIITFSRAFGPGDWITLSGHNESRVVDTDWRSTKLEDENGIMYVVPNSEMISSVIAKGNLFYVIDIPFAIALDTPDVEALLVDCEQVLLDRQIEKDMAHNEMRPKAAVVSTDVDAIHAKVKLYVNRNYDTRSVLRAVTPALVNLLQERGVLAHVGMVSRKDDSA